MKGTSLKSIRKSSIIIGAVAFVLLGVTIFILSMWSLTDYKKAQSDRILGDMAVWMVEHMVMTEAFLSHVSLDCLDESALEAMKVKEMILCSGDGTVTRVFRGNQKPGGFFPAGLLTGKWEVASFLAHTGFPRMILSVRRGDSWLVAGFDSRFFFPDPNLLKDSNSSLILLNQKGMIISAWGEKGIPIGGYFPTELLDGTPKTGIWNDVRVGVHLVQMGNRLCLVQVSYTREVMLRAARMAFLWSAVALVFFAPFMGFFWWILYRITGDLGNSVRKMWETAEDISMADTELEAADKVFSTIESFRTVVSPFKEYNRLLRAFEGILTVISEQGENLTSLYEEAMAMEGQLRESNRMLNLANEKFDGLVNLSQNLERSPSLDAAVDGIAFNLAFAFRCSFVGIVAFRDETPFVWARRGMAPFSLEGDELLELTASFADREEGVIQSMPGFIRTVAPVRFMGHLMGLVIMTHEENSHSDSLMGVMNRFTPMLGGIFYAYSMLREVRKSFHYMATRMQSLTADYHNETGSHLARVGEYSAMIARGLGMSLEYVEDIRIYSQLHDIGKLRLPMEILAKPGGLTKEEFDVVRCHGEYGVDILGDSEWLEMARQVAMTHHEKWDGSGYPKGLRGNQIPLSGRIVALADIYDALRCARAYKPAFSHEKACKIILEGDGRVMPGHFDPDILNFFRENHERFRDIYEKIKDDED